MKKVIWVVLIIIIFGLIIWKLLENKDEAEAKIFRTDPNTKVLVSTVKVSYENLYEEKKYIGTISANRDNKISSETQGKVVYVGVNEGDYLKKGQVIARVDDEMLNLQLEAAEVQLEGVLLDIKRYQNLTEGDAIPAVQLEKTELAKKSIEVQIKILKEQISRTTIVSPFSGVVTMRFFDLGSFLAPGVPLLQLTDISVLKLNVNVPEKEIISFVRGQKISVKTDVYPNYIFEGTVSMVGSKCDNSHNFPVQVMIRNSNIHPLKPGMFGTILVSNNMSSSSLSIPISALVGTIKDPKVYKVEKGTAYLKNITIGVSTKDKLEVLSGLVEGDEIVTSGQINLFDSALVNSNN